MSEFLIKAWTRLSICKVQSNEASLTQHTFQYILLFQEKKIKMNFLVIKLSMNIKQI